MTEIQKIPINQISLDTKNPRLVEFGITSKSHEKEIIEILWNEMAVNELMYSIVSNGFWEYEPLILMREGDKYIAVEGNRRLAAVKLIHGIDKPKGVRVPEHILSKIDPNLIEKTKELPAILIDDRKESWHYLGFKHVNGPAKWGSFAKAKYIAQVHNDFDVPIDEIAYQIGDTHKTSLKLFQALMVLEQAKSVGVYNYEEDFTTPRLYFSHLHTGLQRKGIKEFLSIKDAEAEEKSPIPKKNEEDLGLLLKWLFGFKLDGVPPIISSQNPDLKHLDQILQNKEATIALKRGETLAAAYEESRPSEALFEENLLAAKKNLMNARAYVTTGYKGEESILQAADSVAQLAYDLYEEMDRVFRDQSKQSSRKRYRKR